ACVDRIRVAALRCARTAATGVVVGIPGGAAVLAAPDVNVRADGGRAETTRQGRALLARGETAGREGLRQRNFRQRLDGGVAAQALTAAGCRDRSERGQPRRELRRRRCGYVRGVSEFRAQMRFA